MEPRRARRGPVRTRLLRVVPELQFSPWVAWVNNIQTTRRAPSSGGSRAFVGSSSLAVICISSTRTTGWTTRCGTGSTRWIGGRPAKCSTRTGFEPRVLAVIRMPFHVDGPAFSVALSESPPSTLCQTRGLALSPGACCTVIGMTDTSRRFYHGTRADLNPGDLLRAGATPRTTPMQSRVWIYFSETVNAATWGAELAIGDGPGRIYVVEPTGTFVDDPLTLRTRSFRAIRRTQSIARAAARRGGTPGLAGTFARRDPGDEGCARRPPAD